MDPNGNVVATASNNQSGANASLLAVSLPVDGTYHIQVSAPAGHSSSTGNYVLSVYDATVHTMTVNLNETIYGQIATPYSQDRWTFSALANQQIRFNMLAVANPSIKFDLTGPERV